MNDQEMLQVYYADSGIGVKTENGKVWVLDYKPILVEAGGDGTPDFYWKPLSLWYFQRFVLSQMKSTPEEDLPF